MVILEWRPVAADDTIVCDDGLEDAAVVVSLVLEVGGKDDVTAFVTDEVFVVGGDEKVFAPAESTGATVICDVVHTFCAFWPIAFYLHLVKALAHKHHPLTTVAGN